MTPDQLEDLKGSMAGIKCSHSTSTGDVKKGFGHSGRFEHPCPALHPVSGVCTCCTACMAPCARAFKRGRDI